MGRLITASAGMSAGLHGVEMGARADNCRYIRGNERAVSGREEMREPCRSDCRYVLATGVPDAVSPPTSIARCEPTSARNSYFGILPVDVRGSGPNRTTRGTL